jgi:hypothetical protein
VSRSLRIIECKRCACNPFSSRFARPHHHFQNQLSTDRFELPREKQKHFRLSTE